MCNRTPKHVGAIVIVLAVAASALFTAGRAAAQTARMTDQIQPAAILAEREGMVLVPAGEFKMGSLPSDPAARPDEQPQRILNLPAFFIDQLEVTNIEYKRFVDAMGWPPPPSWRDGVYAENFEFLPVTDVTWWDAMAYARWAGKRLPTEAEWEKAARGTQGLRYPWEGEFAPDLANNDIGLLPAGSLPAGASPCNALDMAGNAAEWTASIYAPYPNVPARMPAEFGGSSGPAVRVAPALDAAARAAADTPSGPESAAAAAAIAANDPRLAYFSQAELQDQRSRVYRGGSFNNYSTFLRCANRQKADPGARWNNVGFRCAADAGSQAPSGSAP